MLKQEYQFKFKLIILIVISDTSPIIYLAKIEKLSILKDLYTKIYIPSEVWKELIYPISQNKTNIPTDIKFEIDAKEFGWLIVKDPEKEVYHEMALNLSRELGRGEAYAIALSLELKADVLLINDKKAKEIAENKGIKTRWNTEVLLDALKQKLIQDYQEFENLLNRMIEVGFWIEKREYEKVILKAKNIMK